MSNEFRRDPLTGEWVTIVGHRQHRPNLPTSGCPFCVGGLEAPDPYVVKAFTNRWPAMNAGEPVLGAMEQATGAFAAVDARGAAEVVLYSPDHDASMATLGVPGVRRVIDLWAERTRELDARPDIEYVLVFENRGREVGATIDHPHGQIYAFPFVPPAARKELDVDASGTTLDQIVAAELVARERVVHTVGTWVAWVPYASAWPFGMLVAPQARVASLAELTEQDRDALAELLVDVLGRYDALFPETAPFPYMLWVHQAPARVDRDHGYLHIHLAAPRRAAETLRFVAGGELGSGVYSNPVPPEHAAEMLRNIGNR